MLRHKQVHNRGKWNIIFFFVLFPTFCFQSARAEPPNGVQSLVVMSNQTPHSLVVDGVRALFEAHELESFLNELEKQPPNWAEVHGPAGDDHNDRLFALNRQRDKTRESHPLLKTRVAFLWSGLITRYEPSVKGYRVAIGPEMTQTKWGIVRFKPSGLPSDMVAVPSPTLLARLQQGISAGEKIEIGILFTGRLIPDESIIYDFSHDGSGQGMVMPVVQVDGIQYFIKRIDSPG